MLVLRWGLESRRGEGRTKGAKQSGEEGRLTQRERREDGGTQRRGEEKFLGEDGDEGGAAVVVGLAVGVRMAEGRWADKGGEEEWRGFFASERRE